MVFLLSRCGKQMNGRVIKLFMQRTITTESRQWAVTLNQSLQETDPELFNIIEKEKQRQRNSLVLIASENFASKSVFDALGSVMSNKYSEGYPGARYYGGNENIDAAETLCQDRALSAFKLDPAEWGVNVQSLSGSPANFQSYSAVLQPHDRILSLDLPHGGHLSHGYQTGSKKISKVSVFFESMPYQLDPASGTIDYDGVERSAALFRPKLIVAGASAYSRAIDYQRMQKIAQQHGAWLLSDMAHISGLVAAGVMPSPFQHSDIVTTTTHKSLRGPRGAMIFYRKGVRSVNKKGEETLYDLEQKINFSVFPGFQGGPHNHTISALATALKQAASPEFAAYQQQVVLNASVLAESLLGLGHHLVSGGTDNHLLLLDLKAEGIDGARVERVLEMVNIASNKNTIPGDASAMVPGGLRVGTPAMTTRGLTQEDFQQVAELLHRGIQIAKDIKQETGRKLADFKAYCAGAGAERPDVVALREDVGALARDCPTVGYLADSMVYKD